ncbi:smad nuclear-interacting protein 1 isoform X1 [Patella vulgata]|uniref:smad nuclear-interacting protein 1 isoform X1 n=2 Tax=Patella vulgata TaxID=6465 RepID=UPI00217FBC4B|nr:smad nuclear-interacting protein 1 isoform X1 [Patella vulgata]
MPRRRDRRSPSYERDKHREKHRSRRTRSPSPQENNHSASERGNKHKARHSRSRSSSIDREHSSHRKLNKHNDSGKHRDRSHRDDEEQQYDPHKRIKQEAVDMTQQRRDRRQNDERRNRARRQREAEGVDTNFGRPDQNAQDPNSQQVPEDKAKPDFKLSGKLTEDTNTFRGVVVNYNEPPEARKPKKKWRLYPFKGDTELPVLHIHRQSAYLVGRDRRVADIPVDHPSCSKQHAALQFRLVEYKRQEDGSKGRKVKPYVIDLNSANGTYVNNQKIDGQRYVELFEKDVVKFGYSSREYVILHDKVDTSELQDEEEEDD